VPQINTAVDRRYASIGEAAAYIKVDERTLRGWIKAGRLPEYWFGPGTRRVDLNELDELGGAR
jgi:excisionase family DNA binding protein